MSRKKGRHGREQNHNHGKLFATATGSKDADGHAALTQSPALPFFLSRKECSLLPFQQASTHDQAKAAKKPLI